MTNVTNVNRENLTPVMRQYLDIKAKNGDAILFFRMGDFYEMFFEDAMTAAKILGIALTSRDRAREIPMCGVPYHSAAPYIKKLVSDGYRVAVCEQVGTTTGTKEIVKREVTRVVTPGAVLEEDMLDPALNNFIAAASTGGKTMGISYMDVSTGEFFISEVAGPEELKEEIRRIRPLELLVKDSGGPGATVFDPLVKKITVLGEYDFGFRVNLERMSGHFATQSLDGFGCAGFTAGIEAAGALLNYIKETQRSQLPHVKKCTPYYTGDFMVLDGATRKNLEIFENARSGQRSSTLLALLDNTRTAMGGRRLKSWLLHPLKDAGEITRRLDAVTELIASMEAREALTETLGGVYDLERTAVRVSMGLANPRDLISLKNSLQRLLKIKEVVTGFRAVLLSELACGVDPVTEAVEVIEQAVLPTPPLSVKDGGVIKAGYNSELDELREISSGGKDWITRLEATERERTGIGSLKVGYNRVFGYYIEVTRANLKSVPEDYIRKQTLVGAERFITGALKEWEARILSAQERAVRLEAELFTGLVRSLMGFTDRIKATAATVSILDVLVSLSIASGRPGYVRPEVNDGDLLLIEGGRHPVVEANSRDDFISNDLRLDNSSNQIIILTGPNMAGKSTYLRQNALICFMAQIGTFIPAERAVVGVVDRIFTRVGATDDLARGQSTFMVEMNETANILNNATPRSLLILDEIGRGTSTFDGLSIAWAVVEYIHDQPGCSAKTLFATHYHELTELSLTKERVKNYNMAVKEWKEKIIFLRSVVPGAASNSYGIQVARLAGIPEGVIERASEVLHNLESGELAGSGAPRLASGRDQELPGRINLLGRVDEVREKLQLIDIDNTTPVEALSLLHKLKEITDD